MHEGMLASARELDVRVILTLSTGTRFELTGDDVIGFSVEEGADSALIPGCVLSAALTLELRNDQGQWRRSLAGATAEVSVMLGDAALPCGVFVIQSASAQEHGGTARLYGQDTIATELAGVFQDTLSYPASLNQIWQHLVGQTRYVWSGELPGGSAVVDLPPNWNGATLRRAAGWIAQVAGCFVRAGRTGSLEIVPCLGGEALSLTPDAYLTLDDGFQSYGPVRGLEVTPVGSDTPFTLRDGPGATVSVSENPLFSADATHVQALAQSMFDQINGLTLNRASFVWRGDPDVSVGSRLSLTDTYGRETVCTVTRQTLRFEDGFRAECACELPDGDHGGVVRVITPEGGVNGSALVGTVDGGLLAAGTVAARAIAAQAITAEKLEASSVTADKLDAGTVSAKVAEFLAAEIEKINADSISTDKMYAALAHVLELAAGSVQAGKVDADRLAAALAEIAQAQITTANIDTANIEWANIASLSAAIASIAQAKIDDASITTAQISDLRAEIAKVITLSAQDGSFDFASIKDLLAQAMILEEGVAGSVMIKNLVATKANFVGATMGELVLQGSDGLYYRIIVQSDGTIRTEPVTLSAGEIAAGQTSDGRQIVATTANVDSLNASDIKAQSAIISDIFTSALTAGSITAQDAFLASATIPELRVTALKALGDTLDISANEQIRLIVGKVDNIQVGGRNLIRDSSMELGTGWNDYSSVSATDGMDGGACFKMEGALNATKSAQQLSAIPEGYFKPGEQYVISYWAKGDRVTYGTTNSLVGLVMEFYSGGTWVGDINLCYQVPAGTSGWTRYWKVVTTPKAEFDRVDPAQMIFRDYTGTVYIDRIQLEKGNQLTDWTLAPEDVDASIQAVANQTAEDMANIVTRIDSDIDNLQSQIDGSITTWFYPVPPTDSNLPTMEWMTTDLKNLHLGDLYYDTITGYCYRWQVQNNTYSWQRITDTDVTKALADASAAQDTADAKRRVFVSQPEPPYDKGDLWTQGSGGDIMRCQTAKISGQSYAASDWVKASKYTDDTAANSALAQVGTLQTTVTNQQTEINQTKEQIQLRATKEEVTQAVNSIQVGGRNLIRDSSMEHGTGWNDYSSVSGTGGVDGGACFKVAGALNATIASSQLGTIRDSLVAEGYFKPGEQYVISYWAKAENLAYGANRYVGVYMSLSRDGEWVGEVRLINAIPAGTSDWTRYSSVVTIPEVEFDTVDPMCVYFRGYTGTVYIDRIQLEKGNKLTDWTPAPEDITTMVDEQSARLDILSDSIASRVEKSTYDQDMDGLREQVSAQYTDFTQTADGMRAEIGELQQDGNELRAYVRYGLENGVGTLSLGQTDSTYKAVINNVGFTIQLDGSDMTYARKNTLSAPVVEARRVFQQGNYTVKVQADGGLMWN